MNIASSGPAWFVPWFLALFPFWWCFTLFLLSRMEGWRRLARRHAAISRPTGETFHYVSGRVANVSHRGSLILTAASEGVYLAAFFLFRPFHPPLLLPWWTVVALETSRGRFGQRESLVITDEAVTLTLYLPAEAREAIRVAAGARFAAIERPPPLT